MHGIRTLFNRVALGVAILSFASTAHAQSCQDLRDLGDTLTWALPIAGLGLNGTARGPCSSAKRRC